MCPRHPVDEAEPLDGRAVVHGEKDVGSVRSTLTLEDRMLGLGLLRREVGPGETGWPAVAGRPCGAAVRMDRWMGDQHNGPGQVPGVCYSEPLVTFVVSRPWWSRTEPSRYHATSRPCRYRRRRRHGGGVGGRSVGGFFSPQPTSTSIAASIMVFFIVAPDTLRFGTAL